MMGLPDAKWQEKEEEVQEQQKQHHEQDHDMKQSTLLISCKILFLDFTRNALPLVPVDFL